MDIPAGYQLHIESWEGDLDHEQTQILDGLSKQDVNFYLDIVSQFSVNPKGLGNSEIRISNLTKIFQTAADKHPDISESVRARLAEVLNLEVEEDEDEEDNDEVYEFLGELLGSSERDGHFCRVFAGHQVYYFEHPVVDVSDDFKIAKKSKPKRKAKE